MVRGITHDRDGALLGALVALTADGKVWKVNSAGGTIGAGPLATIPGGQQVEACVVVPNDSARYGILAGMILAGRDNLDQQTQQYQQGLWKINPTTGAVQQLLDDGNGGISTVGGSTIAAEDLDLIEDGERLHAANWSSNGLFSDHGDPAQLTPAMAGDLLITQEGETTSGTPNFLHLQALGGQLSLAALEAGGASILEHVAFAPLTVAPKLTIGATVASTAEGSPNPAQITISRSAPGPELKVPVKVTGAATFDTDYLATANGSPLGVVSGNIKSVIIPENQTSVVVNVSAYDDSRKESIESVILTLQADTPPTGLLPRYSIPAAPADKATVNIVANDTVTMPTGWKLYDLGVLSTGTLSRATGIGPVINGTATIVGWSRYASGVTNTKAVKLVATPTATAIGGTITELAPFLGGTTWSLANAIDDAGTIVGQGFWNSCPRSYRFPVGGPVEQLLTLAADSGAASTTLVGSDRYTVGYCKAFTDVYVNGTMRATLWKNGTITDLGSLTPGFDSSKASYAFGVNRFGRVVGKSQGATSAFRAFRTLTDSAINLATDDLGTPFGATISEALAINDFDEVVGSASYKAVLWLGHGAGNSAAIQLNFPYGLAPSYNGATAINNSGIAVGWRQSVALGRSVACLWWNDTTISTDLQGTEYGASSLSGVTVVGGGVWTLDQVTGINDSHWMVGYGSLTKNGTTQTHGFLLKPN